MKAFNHINDCWAAISECKTKDEVADLIQTFPNGLGEWWIDVEDDHYIVTNRYYDKQLDDWFEDSEDLEIDVEDEAFPESVFAGPAVASVDTPLGFEAEHVYYDGPNGYDNYILIKWGND